METEKNKKYGCKIFSIFFQNYDLEKAKDTLEKIANYGETNHYLNSNSLDSLYNTFNNISDIIEKTFILKYK